MFIDAVNPGSFPMSDGLRTPREREVARRGDLLSVRADGTGFVARADLSSVLPELDPGERAFLQDLLEEGVEAALHEAAQGQMLLGDGAFALALGRALRTLDAAGHGERVHRISAALANAGPGRPRVH
jgi:hypothetical protein